ncbi:hypothetical protein QQF64_002114 [Cirrhinus molitorella]|uniref:Uncharacterized protein n=2 Tax=Cirrhinus molitorella TaxID=172907 RepID=A0AA88PE27_9TELE|nr:hypothetical protein Q8A67_023529 [Cirrhinus molitorella]
MTCFLSNNRPASAEAPVRLTPRRSLHPNTRAVHLQSARYSAFGCFAELPDYEECFSTRHIKIKTADRLTKKKKHCRVDYFIPACILAIKK